MACNNNFSRGFDTGMPENKQYPRQPAQGSGDYRYVKITAGILARRSIPVFVKTPKYDKSICEEKLRCGAYAANDDNTICL